MKTDEVESLSSLTYRELVAQSIDHLEDLRRRYRAVEKDDQVPPDFPTHVQIQTLGGCNAACGMCPMSVPGYRRMQRGRMPWALFEKIIDECARQEACRVISPYLQNEPLLDREMAGRIRLIKARSHGRLAARIVTNGSLLTPARAEELLETGIDAISISLNAHTKEIYERVMPGLAFQTVRANIETLLDRDLSRTLLTLTFMVTALNEHEIPGAIDYWSGRGVLCGAYGLGTMGGTAEGFERLRTSGTKARSKECFVPLEATAILASGDMLLCCTDWARSAVYGNVAEQDIWSIWHSPRLSAVRRRAIYGVFEEAVCKQCLGQTKTLENLMYAGGPGVRSEER